MRSLGSTTAFTYFFGGVGLPILGTLFTDWTYLDILATSLNVHHGNYFFWDRYKLGDLEKKPRFFFNTTCLETSMPFVLTQSIIHLPEEAGFSQKKPLKNALTLENLYSSPKEFPLNYAAMASAAYPLLNPLSVRKYRFEEARSIVKKTEEVLNLADGGLYDNSGLATTLDLTEYILAKSKDKKRIILIYIDAGIEDYRYNIAKEISYNYSLFPDAIKLKSPLFDPIISGVFRSTDVIHFMNKKRAVKLALERIRNLKKDKHLFTFYNHEDALILNQSTISRSLQKKFTETKNPLSRKSNVKILIKNQKWLVEDREQKYLIEAYQKKYHVYLLKKLKEVLYFPIRLHQLAGTDLFKKVQNIPTDYVISSDDDSLIADAAEVITTNRDKVGWKVGPRENLFSLHLETKYLEELNNDQLSFLYKIFKQKKLTLSKQSAVEVLEKNNKWLVNDRQKQYLLSKEKKQLIVYSPMKTIYHLDRALTYALLRSQLSNWNDILDRENQ